MKKSASKIREDIARMQEQLREAERRDAERIGRIALKAGLADIEIEEPELQAAFVELAKRFRGGKPGSVGRKGAGDSSTGSGQSEAIASGATTASAGEA